MHSAPSRSEISRVLSHALRHAPEDYGLVLDPEGWAPVVEVLDALHRLGPKWEAVDEEALHEVLQAAEKKRHQISSGRIRAVHGHSVPVRQADEPVEPPSVLFHGTARETVPVIRAAGILPMRRQYVHLADTVEQAKEVGHRKDSSPVILAIDTGAAVSHGVSFYRSDSGVWLSGPIPAAAVEILDAEG